MFKAFLVSAFRFSKEIEKLITIRIVASSKIDTAFLFLVLFAFWGRFLFVSFLVWGFRIFFFLKGVSEMVVRWRGLYVERGNSKWRENYVTHGQKCPSKQKVC